MRVKGDVLELGLIEGELRLDVKGLIDTPEPVWNLTAHLPCQCSDGRFAEKLVRSRGNSSSRVEEHS